MAHTHVIHQPSRNVGKTAALAKRFLPAPSIDTPLISLSTYAVFRRGKTSKGRVYPQHRTMDDKHLHPHGFYVEWPACSEQYYEIHAPALAKLAGLSHIEGQTYTAGDCARLISSLTRIPVPMILHAARPRPL